MPQLELATYASQIFWALVCFACLYMVMLKVSLPKVREVLQTRQDRIANDLQKAERLKDEALKAEDDFNTLLEEAKRRAHQMLLDVKQEVKEEEERRHAKLDETFAKQSKTAEKRVAKLKDDAIVKLTPAIHEITQAMVHKLAGIKTDKKQIEAVTKKIAA